LPCRDAKGRLERESRGNMSNPDGTPVDRQKKAAGKPAAQLHREAHEEERQAKDRSLHPGALAAPDLWIA